MTRLEITSRDAVAGGQSFGSAGPYANIRGRVHGEIDPRDRRNRIIQDIDLAPRNARGRVDYIATFSLMMPADLSKSSGVLVYSVVNRGTGAATPGPDGHISLVSGWQGDVAPTATNQTIQVPVARSRNGSPLTGPVLARFSDLPKGTSTAAIRVGSLGTGFYPPATLDTARATLTFHTGETTAGSMSGQGTVPSSEWAFADCRTTPFPGTPDPTRICLAQGFDPARLYDLVYTAKDPLVLGIGFAATRDIVDFFRHAAADASGTANPVAGRVTHGIALGTSQSGNFIKTFVHLGFNEDAAARPVFDGVLPYIAGRQLSMNVRFAAPGGAAGLYEPGSEPALWWGTYKDAERRRSAASLLDRCLRTRTCPKVIEAFGATEFWGLRMSPGLVGTDARHDIALPGNVRRYYMPGTHHGGGAGGFQIAQTGNERCSLPQNPNPMADTHRALVAALVAWVVKETEPPPSRYPTLADSQLAPAATVAAAFPKIPDVAAPEVNQSSTMTLVMNSSTGTSPASSASCPRPSARWCRRSCPASTRTATRPPAWLRRCIRRRSAAISGGTSPHRGSSKARSADSRAASTICGDARRAGKVRRSEAFGRGALRHAGRLRLRGDARGQRARPRPLPAARRRRPPDRQCGKEPHPADDRRERRGSTAYCGYAVQMTEQSPDLPLRGLQVIDFTRVLAGPLCTMLLGDMGAEVIKIEDPRHGDDTRAWAPFVDGWSTYYLTVNRNKKSVAVDLKSEDGRALMEDLFRSADVVIENFRPGTLERLGFGPDRATALNPRLIYCSISGYGTTGPRSDEAGYDMVIQGESGLMDVTGFPETGPTKVGVAITDCLAALYAVQGILLAHIQRQRTGKGQFLDIALLDSAVSVLGLPVGIVAATGQSPGRLGNEHPSLAPYEPYPAADGQVVVAVANPRLWTRFCAAMGIEDLEHDPRFANNTDRLAHRDALNAIIGRLFESQSVDSLLERLSAAGVPCGRVRTIDQVLRDPQLAARQMLIDMPAGAGSVKVPGNPVKLSDVPAIAAEPPPALGQHTEEVRESVRRRQSADA